MNIFRKKHIASNQDKKALAKKRGSSNLFVYLMLMPLLAHADLVGSLNSVNTYMTSTIGTIISTLAVVGVGYAVLVAGKLHKAWLISTFVGIGILFGAGPLVTMIHGA